MKLDIHNAPHIRTRESNRTVMSDAIIAMLPLYAMTFYFYGARSLVLLVISVSVCFGADWLCTIFARRVPNVRDYSPIVTGMIIPLLMPASIEYHIIIIAALFAILIVKHPFGGVGQNIFNPAVGGVAFAMVSWPQKMFQYPIPFESLPLSSTVTVKLVNSPAYALMLGGVPHHDKLDMLLGNVAGPMGATNILVLLTCLLFLVVRNAGMIKMTAGFFAGAIGVALLFPRAMLDPISSVLYELMTGYTVISAVFLVNDPVTSPKRSETKLLYGVICGVVGIGFRHLGRYEDSMLFAILIMNTTVWMLDYAGELYAHKLRRK